MICEGSKNNAAALLYSLSRLTNETANFTPFQGASSARHWHRDRENLCSQHLSNLLQSLQKAKEIILESCYPEELALLRSDYVFAKKTDWVIRFGGDVTFLNEKLKGPIFIQYLLKHQGREIHVARMLADIAGDERLAQASYAGKVSDQTAIQKCRQEYEDLLEAKTEATRTNDVIRLGEIEGEISKLASYLAYCVGLGNRVRNAQDNVSKIRKRIFNVIERAFAKIAKNDPKLEIHLRSFIKTHTYMSYMPDKGIDWNFE